MGTRVFRLWAVVCAGLIVAYCSKSSPADPSPTPSPTPAPSGPAVTSIISSVQAADGTNAVQQTGTPPAASGGPTVSATNGTTAVPGGADVVTLTSTSSFQRVYVSVPTAPGMSAFSFDANRFSPETAANGYYLLTLPSPVTTAVVISNLSPSLPSGTFQLAYAVANAAGAVGPAAASNRTTAGATGNVQVNVSWNTATDVDLHVVDPRGDEIYYGTTQSSSGGSLDVDSNAGCSIDNRNSENIRWGSVAPNGTYTVRVDYWSACQVTGTTTYTVVVNNGGQRSQFTGTFSASDADAGSRGSGRSITAFNHTTGISPSTVFRPIYLDPPFAPSRLKVRQ
jgi:hypothetical protein